MNTLETIKAAAEQLPKVDQLKLFDFLLNQIEPPSASMPAPRELTKEQIEAWIAADETEFAKFKSGE